MNARKITSLALAVGLAISAVAARTQNATARAFDAASVKPNTSDDFRKAIGPGPGGRFQALNNTLRELVTYAYGVDMARAGLQIAGGPPWMDRDRFDIDAVAPGGTATPAEARDMVRALLEERFKLQVRRETREVATYDLVLDRQDARLGARLRASAIDCVAPVVAALKGRAATLVDGGFYSGEDVVKGLALGADMVFLGRGPLYGLAAGGRAGVARALEMYRADVARTLLQIGCPSIPEMRRREIIPGAGRP